MRRRTILKGFEHVTELLTRLLHRHADKRENLLLNGAVMDTDAAASDFLPVADQIILRAARLAGISIEERQVFGQRHGEHVLRGIPALFFLVPVEFREVDDPEE